MSDEQKPDSKSDSETVIRLGRYTIHELIGRGGMAEVYRASAHGPEGFEKPVVLKRLKPALLRKESARTMFIDEARINATLDHANIVTGFDFGELEGNYFFTMEYVEGLNLREVMRRHHQRFQTTPPWEVITLILRDVCRGLHYTHRKSDLDGNPLGIVHRDVNMVNVMLRRDGAVKLLDFGCAKACDEIRMAQTSLGIIKGKLAYMSPEQTLAEDLDGRSDLFSVGTMGHEMLTGRPLFHDKSEIQAILNVRNLPIPDIRESTPQVPEALVNVIMKALSREREQRYHTAGAMANALEEIIFVHRIPQDRLGSLAAMLIDDLVPAARRRVSDEHKALTLQTWRSSAARSGAPGDASGQIGEAEPYEDDIPTLDITAPSGQDQAADQSVHSRDILAVETSEMAVETQDIVDVRALEAKKNAEDT